MQKIRLLEVDEGQDRVLVGFAYITMDCLIEGIRGPTLIHLILNKQIRLFMILCEYVLVMGF